jgi:hypothetical protein
VTDPLTAWVLAAMVHWLPASPAVVRARYEPIAEAITAATQDPDEAAVLAAIAKWETGFRQDAVGKLGERGAWQLMPPAPFGLRAQAREARRRMLISYGLCGTLAKYASGSCFRGRVAAARREGTAMGWLREHPFHLWKFDELNPGRVPACLWEGVRARELLALP